jgi:hypothetical protein
MTALLLPALAIAQSNDSDATDLQAMTVPELCAHSDDPDVLEELKHRDVFSRMEMKAVERKRLREGLSEAALVCMLGEPQTIYPVRTYSGRGSTFEFVYPISVADAVIVRVRIDEDESVVTSFYQTNDEKTKLAMEGLAQALECSVSSARGERCAIGNMRSAP